jgi:hypothetical protein
LLGLLFNHEAGAIRFSETSVFLLDLLITCLAYFSTTKVGQYVSPKRRYFSCIYLLLAWLTFQPWRWEQYAPP